VGLVVQLLQVVEQNLVLVELVVMELVQLVVLLI